MFRCGWSVLLLCICISGYSQIDTIWKNEVLFKTELTSISPTYYPNLQLELEIPFFKKTAFVLAGGPMIHFAFPAIINGVTSKNLKGYFLNPSFKKYLNKDTLEKHVHYVSFEVDYRESTFDVIDRFISTTEPLLIYDDTITVHNHARGFTFNYGIMLSRKHFGLELSAGLGLMFNQNSYSRELHPGATFAEKKLWNIWQRESFPMIRMPTRILLFYRF